jgi:glyoxylase-like metal-dependent hydrolase (beta-lactamase superfamily II)/rhodanese-related sulfurtransferase
MFFFQKSLEGLGCFSYMIGSCQTGECAVVDPQRDIADYLEIAAEHGLKITHLIETHVHADHVSGSQELAAQTGATIYIHENAGACYPHQPLNDGDRLTLGECRIDVLFTPGHTLDSICLLVTDMACGDQPAFVLAGDTLFIGDVGRPDLVPGMAATAMAALLYDSLHGKLMALPDDLPVYPGHGAGSLCGRSMQAGRWSTIGRERHANHALQAPSRDEFIRRVALDLPQQPANSCRIKELNRHGAALLSGCGPRPLDPNQVLSLLGQDHILVDIRSLVDFNWGHARGAINIPLDSSEFCRQAGQLLPPGAAVVLIDDDTPDTLRDDIPNVEKASRALACVGYDRVVGFLDDGMCAWQRASLPTVSITLQQASPDDVASLMADECCDKPQIIDVREPWEWEQGHLPEALHIPLNQLDQRAHEVDQCRPVIAYCRAGTRSLKAASLLAQLGHRAVYNLAGGIESWRQAGYPVAVN